MELRKLLAEQGITNFTAEELTHGREVPAGLLHNIVPTAAVLQAVRNALGVPIAVHSGYRNALQNKMAGGTPASLHLSFNAIDFCPAEYTPAALLRLAHRIARGEFACMLQWRGEETAVVPGVMGIGTYACFLHIDTRGLLGRRAPARWQV